MFIIILDKGEATYIFYVSTQWTDIPSIHPLPLIRDRVAGAAV